MRGVLDITAYHRRREGDVRPYLYHREHQPSGQALVLLSFGVCGLWSLVWKEYFFFHQGITWLDEVEMVLLEDLVDVSGLEELQRLLLAISFYF